MYLSVCMCMVAGRADAPRRRLLTAGGQGVATLRSSEWLQRVENAKRLAKTLHTTHNKKKAQLNGAKEAKKMKQH